MCPPVLTSEGGHKVKVEGHCPSTFKIDPAPMLNAGHHRQKWGPFVLLWGTLGAFFLFLELATEKRKTGPLIE